MSDASPEERLLRLERLVSDLEKSNKDHHDSLKALLPIFKAMGPTIAAMQKEHKRLDGHLYDMVQRYNALMTEAGTSNPSTSTITLNRSDGKKVTIKRTVNVIDAESAHGD